MAHPVTKEAAKSAAKNVYFDGIRNVIVITLAVGEKLGCILKNDGLIKQVHSDSAFQNLLAAEDQVLSVNNVILAGRDSKQISEVIATMASHPKVFTVTKNKARINSAPAPAMTTPANAKKASSQQVNSVNQTGFDSPKTNTSYVTPSGWANQVQGQAFAIAASTNHYTANRRVTPPTATRKKTGSAATSNRKRSASKTDNVARKRAKPEKAKESQRRAPVRKARMTAEEKRQKALEERQKELDAAYEKGYEKAREEQQAQAKIDEANKYLPIALQNLHIVTVEAKNQRHIERPGTRLYIKQALISVYDLHESIEKLKSILPQVEASTMSYEGIKQLIEKQKCQMNAILTLGKESDEPKLLENEKNLLQMAEYKIKHGSLDGVKSKKHSNLHKYSNYLADNYSKYRKEGILGKNLEELRAQKHKNLRSDLQYYRRATFEEDRVLLEGLGYKFPVEQRFVTHTFAEMLEKLKIYKEVNGNTKVPQLYKTEDGAALGAWVASNRKQYELMKCGQKGHSLTPERIEQLESLGFIWKLRFGRPKKNDAKFRNRRLGIGYDDEKGKTEEAETQVAEAEEKKIEEAQVEKAETEENEIDNADVIYIH